MDQIGRYEIRNIAGHGGMATVYEAFDPHFQRAVAVKVMTAELLENDTLKIRFRQEAQIIAALEHPAIVPVYDFGEENARPFLVMRLMTGGTLADRLQGGPLSVAETAEILKRIGSALDRAHEVGVIHRDLKPSNIIFDQYGDAFLADFGIARLTERAVTLTGENVIGTPAYMSPEQIHGDQAVDGRSDIYALGVICFEMLTGRRPYQETAPARLMMQHLIDPVPNIREIRPDLPREVDVLITRAMAKSPDKRYDHAKEIADTLASLASIDAVTAAGIKGEEAGKGTAVVASAVLLDKAVGVDKEPLEAELTIPDSAEMAPQQPAVDSTPRSTPAVEPPAPAEHVPESASHPALAEVRRDRRKWIIGGAAVGIVLITILAVVFFGDSFINRAGEPADVAELHTAVEMVVIEGDDISLPEDEDTDESTAVPDNQAALDALMERFYVSMDGEDYGAADEAINEAIAMAPEEAWLHGEKAWLLETTGDSEGALFEIQIALELDPTNGDHYMWRGNILRELGDLDAALANHMQAVEMNPDDPYLHMELAVTYKQLDDAGMALEQYNQALALKDDDAWFYGARAEIFYLLGDYEMMVADLEQASELEPEQRDFFTQAGDMLLHDVNDPERALEYFTRAVERTPEDGWAYVDRASAYEAMGNIDAALADLNRAIELNPDDSSFYIHRAQFFLYVLDDQDAALADLNRAVEVDPENPDPFAERSSFFHEYAGDLESALADRSRALELEPDGPWRYNDRAVVYRAMGRYEEARADLDHCLELEPQYYWCSWERGLQFEEDSQTEEAVADFLRFLDLGPEDDCPDCRAHAEQYVEAHR